MVISFIVAIIVVIIDQLTKFLIYGTPSRSIIGNLLWFESTLNTGVAFSMFENFTTFFTIFSAVAVIAMGYIIISNRFFKNRTEKIMIAVIMGGAFSNLIDRVVFKGVRDFIYLKFIDFAIFNIADMAVSIGAVVFFVYMLIKYIIEQKNTNKEINSSEPAEKEGEKND